jgi:hypothetical protein
MTILKLKIGIIISITLLICNHASAQNLVKNPGFETGEFIPYWAIWPNNVANIATIDPIDPYSGLYCAKLTGNEVYLYQRVSLEPNTTYTLKASVKSLSGVPVFLGANNFGNESVSITFEDTDYKTDSLTFTTGANPDNDPTIYIYKTEGTGDVWVDAISLVADLSGHVPDEPAGLGTYYINPLGDDNNTGTSPSEAWQTIDKANQMIFQPGDQILFEGGKTFAGTLRLNEFDSGVAGNPVTIGSYGSGRATIDAGTNSGFVATDCQYLNIHNLIFTGNGRKTGNEGNGIILSYCSNIVIDSVEIRGFQHSGLSARNVGDNLQFTKIYAHENGYAGIYLAGTYKTALSQIYIGQSIAENNPGDPTVLNNHSGNGIFVYNASNILIEYCVASNNGWDMPRTGNGPGGIWVAEVDGAVIQHCISHDNKTSDGGLDGVGFDLDGGTTNSTIQYCLSYNNQGAGYAAFQYSGATNWGNNTIRYCISENDGNISGKGSIEFWNGTNDLNTFKNLNFYNNVVYNSDGPALAFLDHLNVNFNFYNNIFVSKQSSVYNGIDQEKFQGNCWYSFNNSFYLESEINFEEWAQANNQEMLNSELVGFYADPLFLNPGNTTLIDPFQLTEMTSYTVQGNSPVINAGLDLISIFSINPGSKDFSGYPLTQGMEFDMGIYEYQEKQVLTFSPGWNIVSMRVMPEDSCLMFTFQPFIDSSNLKKVMDENGNSIEDFGFLGGWKNNIGNLDRTKGYKVNLTSADTLEIKGIGTKSSVEIQLSPGWNIISWPLANEQDGLEVFQPLIDEEYLIKVMDENGHSIENFGFLGGWQNNIGNLKPGKGYRVNVTTNCSLTIN